MSNIGPKSPQYLKRLMATVAGAALIGFSSIGAGAVSRTLEEKIQERGVTVSDFGDITDTATIDAALAASDIVTFTAGEYPAYDFSASGKAILFEPGVVFKLADGVSDAAEVVPFSTFHITGDDNSFFGDFSVDGNAAGNSMDSTNLSHRLGAFAVQGNNTAISGEVKILTAYYVGYSIGADDTDVALNFAHNGTVRVISADSYNFICWSAIDWFVQRIVCEDNTQGFNNRIQTSTQTSSTKFNKNGFIGEILAPNTYCVFEKGTINLDIGRVICAGGKTEEVEGVSIGSLLSQDLSFDANAWTNISSNNVKIGRLTVNDYDGLQEEVVQFSGSSTNIDIGTISVSGTKERAGNPRNDVVIYGGDGLHIGNIFASGSLSLGGLGFFFNPISTVKNITIDNIVSSGHDGNDVHISGGYDPELTIKKVNADAVSNVSFVENVGHYDEQSITVTATAVTSGTVTLGNNNLTVTKHGRLVTVTGTISISSVASPNGELRIGNLPYVPYAAGKAREAVVHCFWSSLKTGFVGSVVGKIAAGNNYISLWRMEDATFYNLAQHMQAGAKLTISVTYPVR